MNKRAAHVLLHVNMPNGKTIGSTHTGELLLSALPPGGEMSAYIARISAQFFDFCRTIMRQRMRRHI
jgi:hypothetical protein